MVRNLTRKISYFQLYNSIFRSIFNGFQQSWSQNLSIGVFSPQKYKFWNFNKSLLFYCWLNNRCSFLNFRRYWWPYTAEISEFCKQLMLIKRALYKESSYEISLKLDEKCSRGISNPSQIVFFQLLNYTCFSGAIYPLQVPDWSSSDPTSFSNSPDCIITLLLNCEMYDVILTASTKYQTDSPRLIIL